MIDESMQLLARLRSEAGRQNPYPLYARLRAQGPLLPTPWGGLLATDYATCDQVLRSPEWQMPTLAWKDAHLPGWREHPSLAYASRTLMHLNPPEHTARRAMVAPWLTVRSMRLLEPSITRLADRRLQLLAEELDRNGQADYAHLVASPLPMLALCELLGVPVDMASQLIALVRTLAPALEASPGHRGLPAADRSALALHELAQAVAARPPTASRPGLFGHLLSQARPGREKDEALMMVASVLVAGWQTSAALLNSMVLGLDRFPDEGRWLHRRPDGIAQAVEELLRWDPPTQLTNRIATADMTLAGRRITAGQAVHVLIGSAQQDPAIRPDPERLDLSRPAGKLLVFGRGPHYCVGAQLARCQARVMLPMLLRRFGALRVAGPVKRPRGISFRDVISLPVQRA